MKLFYYDSNLQLIILKFMTNKNEVVFNKIGWKLRKFELKLIIPTMKHLQLIMI